MASIEIIFKLLGNFETCEAWHQYIADDEIGIVCTCTFQTRKAVCFSNNFKIKFEFFFQEFAYVVVILYDEQFVLVRRFFFLCYIYFQGAFFFVVFRFICFLFEEGVVRNEKVFFFVCTGVDGEGDCEDGASSLVLIIIDSPFMDIYQFVCQM